MRFKKGLPILLGFALILSYQNCSRLIDSNHQEGLSSLANSPQLDLSVVEADAMKVLEQKCLSCHDQNATNPLKDILNKEKMILEGYVVIGEPQSSPIYIDVIDGQMPPDAPLNNAEVSTLKLWLLGENALSDSLSDVLAPPTDGPVIEPAKFTEVQALLRNSCGGCHLNGNNRGCDTQYLHRNHEVCHSQQHCDKPTL